MKTRLKSNLCLPRVLHCFSQTNNPDNFHPIFAKFFSVSLILLPVVITLSILSKEK